MTAKNTLTTRLTPHLMAEIISADTGQKVTTDTHWFKASMECTRQSPPYSLIQITATRIEK